MSSQTVQRGAVAVGEWKTTTMNPMEHDSGFRYGSLRNGNRPGNPNTAPRCQAHPKNGEPCHAPAVRNRRTCRMHGGTGRGPITPAGLERSRKARWKTGWFSREARELRRAEMSEVRQIFRDLRDAIAIVGDLPVNG